MSTEPRTPPSSAGIEPIGTLTAPLLQFAAGLPGSGMPHGNGQRERRVLRRLVGDRPRSRGWDRSGRRGRSWVVQGPLRRHGPGNGRQRVRQLATSAPAGGACRRSRPWRVRRRGERHVGHLGSRPARPKPVESALKNASGTQDGDTWDFCLLVVKSTFGVEVPGEIQGGRFGYCGSPAKAPVRDEQHRQQRDTDERETAYDAQRTRILLSPFPAALPCGTSHLAACQRALDGRECPRCGPRSADGFPAGDDRDDRAVGRSAAYRRISTRRTQALKHDAPT